MQGKKATQEEMFFYGSLEDLVPQDDPFRRLDGLLDLAWLRQETQDLYSSTGRPSVDPVVIVKLLLVAYLKDIGSERELMRQVQVNLSYRRFLHYRLSESLPDHSNLTRSRQRLGEATIRKFFEYVLKLCIDAGLVGGDLESIDSTFVQANASLNSLQPRLVVVEAESITRKLFLVDSVEATEQEAEVEGDQSGDKTAADKEGSAGQQAPDSGGKTDRLNDRFVSKTDPDSGLYRKMPGKSPLGFLTQFAVDRNHQVITGVLTTGAQDRDTSQIVPLVDQILGQGIAVRAIVADRGYSAAQVYHDLDERGIEAFIPLLRRGPETLGYFGRDRFIYDPNLDRYRCPNGAWLSLQKRASDEIRYRAKPSDCAACPLRALCTSGKVRSLKLSRYEDVLAKARRRQATVRARRAARERKICSERTFAEAKNEHGLSHAHQRGLANVRIQSLLTATTMNLKRYLKAQTRVFPATVALIGHAFSFPAASFSLQSAQIG